MGEGKLSAITIYRERRRLPFKFEFLRLEFGDFSSSDYIFK